MNHYRTLNKELIEQLQTMRVNLKLYCDEIVHLKAELMQKHEREVVLRKQCYNWAVDNFLQLIQTVQPEADILPVLKENVQQRERIPYSTVSSVESRVPRNSRFSEESFSDARRRSSLLTMELQRSNSLVSARKSVRSTSPIRRSGNETGNDEEEEEFEREEQEVQTNNQQPQEVLAENDNELVSTQKDILQNPEWANIIYEESDGEEDDEEEEDGEEDHDTDVESVYESVDEITVPDITHARSTLKDVTNTVATLKDTTKNNNSHSKTVRRNRRFRKAEKTSTDQENSTDGHTTSMEFDTDTELAVTIGRRRYQTRLTDKTATSMDEETVEEPRRQSNDRHASVTSKSIPITQDCNETYRNVTTVSPSSIYTDMTLRNFKDAPSSTPNSRRNSCRKPTTPPTMTTASNSAPDFESESTNFSNRLRPSRRCKPKELTEPKLGTKLRNENATKAKPRSKNKKKATKNAK